MTARGPQNKMVVLVGPTSVGKTGLALRLAQTLNGEIVGADSMQIYRGMDIGTAKPTREERARVPHHLIDIVNPDESFHAKRYQQAADLVVQEIHGRGRLPIVVGGTGLYIKALLHGLFPDPPVASERPVPQGRKAGQGGGGDPHAHLRRVDPVAARAIHPHDAVRARRALDVFLRTGRSITEWQSHHGFGEDRYDALVLGLWMDRERLNRRIHSSVDRMIREGFLQEVRALLKQGFSRDLPSMKSLGYRHMVSVLEGTRSLEEAVALMERDTRRYAKRQRTWFQHQEKVVWFSSPDASERIYETIQEFLDRQVKKIV
jgi:tRNA dimethylallyltransferase